MIVVVTLVVLDLPLATDPKDCDARSLRLPVLIGTVVTVAAYPDDPSVSIVFELLKSFPFCLPTGLGVLPMKDTVGIVGLMEALGEAPASLLVKEGLPPLNIASVVAVEVEIVEVIRSSGSKGTARSRNPKHEHKTLARNHSPRTPTKTNTKTITEQITRKETIPPSKEQRRQRIEPHKKHKPHDHHDPTTATTNSADNGTKSNRSNNTTTKKTKSKSTSKEYYLVSCSDETVNIVVLSTISANQDYTLRGYLEKVSNVTTIPRIRYGVTEVVKLKQTFKCSINPRTRRAKSKFLNCTSFLMYIQTYKNIFISVFHMFSNY
uniref:Putative secreted protein n=1 Tax=Anopheles darlingi TaxID=43151 RepID=A0A2M4DCR0_ANODA